MLAFPSHRLSEMHGYGFDSRRLHQLLRWPWLNAGVYVILVALEGGQREAVRQAMKTSHVGAEVTDDTPERLSLRPVSGSGDDALDLANFIHENAQPAASSVRMVQVVPKPAVKR